MTKHDGKRCYERFVAGESWMVIGGQGARAAAKVYAEGAGLAWPVVGRPTAKARRAAERAERHTMENAIMAASEQRAAERAVLAGERLPVSMADRAEQAQAVREGMRGDVLHAEPTTFTGMDTAVVPMPQPAPNWRELSRLMAKSLHEIYAERGIEITTREWPTILQMLNHLPRTLTISYNWDRFRKDGDIVA